MPRAVLFLAAFLSLANAQAPRSAVFSALAPESQAVVPLADLIKGFDDPGKAKALDALDKLDRAPLSPADLNELSEAYRLLGRTSAGTGAGGATEEIRALARSGDYKSAQAAAEAALKKYPNDPNLLAAYHQVKNRAPVGPDWGTPAATTAGAGPRDAGSAADSRPYVLPIKGAKIGVPPSPQTAYITPGTPKRSSLAIFFDQVGDFARYLTDSESPLEKQRMQELRSAIDGTETGRQLVSDLGGWERIDRDVDMRFTAMGDDRKGAYAGPFGRDDKPYKLVINTKMLDAPREVAVPVVAHEMSHLRDFIQHGAVSEGLAIPSEFAAHRTQIQVFEELKAKMTPAELKAFGATPRGSSMNFIALLWEDHLLQRFPNADALSKATGDGRRYRDLSVDVMKDLRAGMEPGGFQLDYHINGERGGLYRTLTSERDIVDIIKEREASGNYTEEERKRDQEILARRNELLRRSDQRDSTFRAAHGFQLGAGK